MHFKLHVTGGLKQSFFQSGLLLRAQLHCAGHISSSDLFEFLHPLDEIFQNRDHLILSVFLNNDAQEAHQLLRNLSGKDLM